MPDDVGVNGPVAPEALASRDVRLQTNPLAVDGALHCVWKSRFGTMLIEVRAGRTYVNGQPVEPTEAETQSPPEFPALALFAEAQIRRRDQQGVSPRRSQSSHAGLVMGVMQGNAAGDALSPRGRNWRLPTATGQGTSAYAHIEHLGLRHQPEDHRPALGIGDRLSETHHCEIARREGGLHPVTRHAGLEAAVPVDDAGGSRQPTGLEHRPGQVERHLLHGSTDHCRAKPASRVAEAPAAKPTGRDDFALQAQCRLGNNISLWVFAGRYAFCQLDFR